MSLFTIKCVLLTLMITPQSAKIVPGEQAIGITPQKKHSQKNLPSEVTDEVEVIKPLRHWSGEDTTQEYCQVGLQQHTRSENKFKDGTTKIGPKHKAIMNRTTKNHASTCEALDIPTGEMAQTLTTRPRPVVPSGFHNQHRYNQQSA